MHGNALQVVHCGFLSTMVELPSSCNALKFHNAFPLRNSPILQVKPKSTCSYLRFFVIGWLIKQLCALCAWQPCCEGIVGSYHLLSGLSLVQYFGYHLWSLGQSRDNRVIIQINWDFGWELVVLLMVSFHEAHLPTIFQWE